MSRVEALIDRMCPNGVPYKSITDLSSYVRGVTYEKSDEDAAGGVSILRANNITLASNRLNFVDVKRVSATVRVRDDQRLRTGDILICAGSGSRDHIGKVAFIERDLEETFGGFMGVVRVHANAGLDPRFLFHLLTGNYFSGYLRGALSSTTISNLNAAVMRGFKIPVPPLDVQCEIVRALDEFVELSYFLEAEINARKMQYQYILEELTSPWDLNGNIKPGWSSAKMEDVCSVNKGTTPIQKAVPGEYPLVATTVERRSSHDFQFEADALCIPLVSSKGHGVASISRVYFQTGKFALGNILAAVIPTDPTVLSANFLYHYFEVRKDFLLAPLMRGGANVSLSVNALKSVRVFFPAILEQKQICAVLRQIDDLINDDSGGLVKELESRRAQYAYYRDKLLTFGEAAA